jgi:hypothetical protein
MDPIKAMDKSLIKVVEAVKVLSTTMEPCKAMDGVLATLLEVMKAIKALRASMRAGVIVRNSGCLMDAVMKSLNSFMEAITVLGEGVDETGVQGVHGALGEVVDSLGEVIEAIKVLKATLD